MVMAMVMMITMILYGLEPKADWEINMKSAIKSDPPNELMSAIDEHLITDNPLRQG